MAEEREDQSREDLTDDISQHRLEEYRRKGMVSQSKELTGLAALLAAGVALYATGPQMGDYLAEFMREVFRTDLAARSELGTPAGLGGFMVKAVKITAAVGLPICLAGFFFAVLGSYAQIGSIFSTDPLTPDLSKINPLQGLQRLVSIKNAVDGFRLIMKATVAVAVAYSLVKTEVLSSSQYMVTEPAALFAVYAHAGKVIFLSLVSVLAVFALIDFGFQRREYNKNLRLTKQEAKQEHKEREGDPQIKARVRAIQREMARRRMMQAVRKATVIVTNPTHFAVALEYDKDKMGAPRVVAKGADFLAQKIKSIAAEAGIPLVENVPLARTLYKSVKVGQVVPRALYQAVAEVLAYVYRLKKREF